MDRMIIKILGYEDARYALNNYLTVNIGPRLSDAYGRKHDTINLSITLLPSSPCSKFSIDINIPGAILRLNAENLILYHNEISESLKQLKCLVISRRKRQQEIAEYEKHLAELQQSELEKLYNQYS
jgi:hypothetical protein